MSVEPERIVYVRTWAVHSRPGEQPVDCVTLDEILAEVRRRVEGGAGSVECYRMDLPEDLYLERQARQ